MIQNRKTISGSNNCVEKQKPVGHNLPKKSILRLQMGPQGTYIDF